MITLERRAITELRAAGRKLEGYAARFNIEARIADFTEVIRAGAFSNSLAGGRDILALVAQGVLVQNAPGGRSTSYSLEERRDGTSCIF